MKLSRLRSLILFLLFLSTVINYVDRQALSVLLPTLRGELGISSAEYGTITTLFLTAYTIGQLFAGIVIDRIGTRRGFALSIVAWSFAAIAHAFARGPLSFGLLRFALGIGEAGNWPAGGKAVAQWFPQHRRAFGMAVFDGGSAVGAIIAPPMVAALALYFGWRAAFVVTGALGFLWFAAWWFIYQTPEEHRWLSEADRATASKDSGAAQTRKATFGAALAQIIGWRQLWGLMATRMLATPVWWFYVFWLPDYLNKGRGFTLKEIGMFGWIPYLTVDIGKLIGGACSDRLLARGRSATFARKSVMVVGAIAMAAGVLVVGANTSAGAIAWVCVATFGFGLWSANILALHADIFPTETMGTAVGLTGMASSLGGSIFTYASGLMVDRTGYQPVFAIAGTLALLACIALFVGVGRVTSPQLKTV
ncbi:MAG: MFS transporter [Acidobacteria bacterium]|nr:MFS transporter [Acidobacteriota bacterium]MBI3425484.1 MFS transporter [Acidobacteriota bacterium]